MPVPFEQSQSIHRRNGPPFGGAEIDFTMRQDEAFDEELKFPRLKYVGQGNQGLAYYDPDSNSFVKYTTESKEADAAETAMQINAPCTAAIYEVNRVGKAGVYRIRSEPIRTLQKNQSKIITKIYFKYVLQSEYTKLDFGTIARFMPVNIRQHSKLIYDYIDMLNCLAENGFSLSDTHGGNIGYNRNGRLVLFDLGAGRSITRNAQSNYGPIALWAHDGQHLFHKMVPENYQPWMGGPNYTTRGMWAATGRVFVTKNFGWCIIETQDPQIQQKILNDLNDLFPQVQFNTVYDFNGQSMEDTPPSGVRTPQSPDIPTMTSPIRNYSPVNASVRSWFTESSRLKLASWVEHV